jgi:MinD superfamily P-loop ATPase
MRLAIASGKGGTGKTTVATNLAMVAARHGRSVAFVDCDVEEPNGHLFLKPELSEQHCVHEPVPQVDLARCVWCDKCSEICQFSAIVCIGEQVLVYPDLCHGCGGCVLVCPAGAIAEFPHEIGIVESGWSGPVQYVSGKLHIGKARAVPVIRAAKSTSIQADLTILDAPPGTSCPVVETVRDTDYVILVTEPTPFGLHDLKIAVDVVRKLQLPHGVVVNRASLSNPEVRSFCTSKGIPILAEIPDDRRVAEAYSRGQMACEALPEYESVFVDLLDAVEEQHASRAA